MPKTTRSRRTTTTQTTRKSHTRGQVQPPKQTTRMLKVVCEAGTGYTARLTRKWLDTYGAPVCACCGKPMVEV